MKKTMKRLSVFLLGMLLCLGSMTISVFATTQSQDGLEVTLTTDKEKYSQNDQIVATLSVKNTNDFAVKNLSLESITPEGYKLSKGASPTEQIESLKAGEIITLKVTYVEEVLTSVDEKDDIKTDIENVNKENASKNNGNIEQPDTGDKSNFVIWIVLMGAAGLCVVGIIVKNKKNGKKILSLFLCISMTGSLLMGTASIKVKAAGYETKSFTVNKVVEVDKKNLELKAVVKYQLADIEKNENVYSRGEWIEKLVKAYGFPNNTEGKLITYTDIEESQYRQAIETAVVYNILTPKEGESFNPNELTTREFAAETAVNSMGYELGDSINCLDKSDIKNPRAIKIAVELGLLSLENNYFYPNRALSKVEADNILKLVEKEYHSLNNEEEYDDVVFLDNVVQKDTSFDWSTDGNTAIVPLGEEKPKVGQILAFKYETAIRVDDVKEVNGQTQIKYSTPELNEFIDSMNIQGKAVMDFSKFKPAEGVSVNNDTSKSIQTFGFADDAFDIPSTEMSSDIETELSGSIDLEEGWEIGYSLDLNIPSVGYKFDVDFDANPFNDIPPINVKNAYIKVQNDITTHVDFGRSVDTGDDSFDDSEFDDILEKEINLGSVPLVGVNGLGVEVELDLVLTAEGKFEIDYNVHGTTGIQVRNNRPKNISALQSSLSLGLQASVSAGPRVGLEAEIFGEDILDFSAEAGGKASGSVYTRSTGLVCMDARAFVYAKLQAFNDCLIDDWLNLSVTYPIWNENNSPIQISGHWENLNKVPECTYDNKGTIRGTVANADDRTKYIKGAVIEVMDHDNFENETTVYSNSKGEYVAAVPGGTHLVRISADGYLPFESLETVGEKQEIFLETYLLVEGSENSNEKGAISGKITNVVTGSGISDVQLTVRKGWNMTSGDIIKSLETDSSGKYSTILPIGNYTIEMRHNGYITNHINIAVTKNGNNNCHGTLAPDGDSPVELGDMRIVLTWADEPADLDSHLWGPQNNNDDMYHIYYSDMSYYDGNSKCAFLDLDDTSYYGPETTTIYDMKPKGVYSFYVHDFTNRGSNSSTVLANSGAKVQVYMGNKLIGQYSVPTSGVGDVWHVFNFDATTGLITPVNKFSCVDDPYNVGNPNAIMSMSSNVVEKKSNYQSDKKK